MIDTLKLTTMCLIAVVLSLSLCHGSTDEDAGYVNDWNQPFDFRCPVTQIINYISSVHDNRYQDRRWEFHCRTVGGTENCTESEYVNDFEEMVVFRCPEESILTGVASFHENGPEDRRFKFHCCTIVDKVPAHCYMSGLANNWDDKLTLFVREGRAIKGVYSWHDNHNEDRRWKFELCYI